MGWRRRASVTGLKAVGLFATMILDALRFSEKKVQICLNPC